MRTRSAPGCCDHLVPHPIADVLDTSSGRQGREPGNVLDAGLNRFSRERRKIASRFEILYTRSFGGHVG